MKSASQIFAELAEPFKYDEIEWRLARVSEYNGKINASVLAFINARAVMDRLDDVVGPENWQDSYRMEGVATICNLKIRVAGEWISKEDGSDASDIEAVKGAISGALKRTAVKFGVGRYLYQLKDGWAEIVDKSNREAYWGKTKDNKEFHWLPPKLPHWALPSPLKAGLPEGFGISIVKPDPTEPSRITEIKSMMQKAINAEHLSKIWEEYQNDLMGQGMFANEIKFRDKAEEDRVRADMMALKDQLKAKLVKGR